MHGRQRLTSVIAASLGMAMLFAWQTGSRADDAKDPNAVVIAFSSEPDSLDPCDARSNANGRVFKGNVVETLTQLNGQTGAVEPLLATSWEPKGDTAWIFHLRPSVVFHDGAPFDANAASFAINRTLNSAVPCKDKSRFPIKTSVKVIDNMTIELDTETPDPILPKRMANLHIASPNTPADARADRPIGTGPYEFVDRKIGQYIDLKRFDKYWGDKPQITAAHYIWRAEDAVRAGTVTTGEADLAIPIAQENATGDDRTQPYSEQNIFFVRVKQDKAPLNDVRVRQAIAYSIDRDTIATSLMGQAGAPVYQMITSWVDGFIPDYKAMAYDPAKAKELLAAAKADSVPVDTPITLIANADQFPGSDEVTQAIADSMRAVGLNINLQTLEHAAWLQRLQKPFPEAAGPEMQFVAHDNVGGDASFTFPVYVNSTGGQSTGTDTAIDDLVTQAMALSGDKRTELFQEAGKRAYETDAFIIPAVEIKSILLLGKDVDYKPDSLTGVQVRLADIKVHR